MSLDNIYKAIDEEIARLRNIRALLEASLAPAMPTNGNGKGKRKRGRPRKKTGHSAEGLARIAAAQRARWRKQKRAAKAAEAIKGK